MNTDTPGRVVVFFVALFVFTSLAAAQQAPPAAAATPTDAKALAYYHFTLAHLYEEMAGDFAHSEYLRKAIEEYKEALKYDPDSIELTVDLADAYRRSGRIREAVLEAQQLLKNNPDNLSAHRLLGRIYFQTLGEPQPGVPPKQTLALAIEEYENIARLAPDDTDALLVLARLYRMNNDLPRAEATLKKLLSIEPQSETGLAALAMLYSDQGDYQKAIDLLQGAASDSASARLIASLAYAYEQAGDFPHAIETYRRALQHDKENPDLRRRLAESLLRADRLDEALAEYQAVLDADSDDAQSYLRLSQIYRHQRRFAEARAALDKAKELAPDNLEIGFNESLLEEAQGEFRKAIAVLSEMVAKMTHASGQYSPDEVQGRGLVLERLGILYRQTEDFDNAVQVFKLMLELGEQSAQRAYGQMGETYRQGKQLDAALAIVRQGLERFPDDRDLKLQLASLLGDHGELEAAVTLARSLLANTAEDRTLHLALAQIYQVNKHYPEAEAEVTEAEKLSQSPSERESALFLRGAIFERQKKYDLAEAEFRKVLEINPESAVTLNYLGYMFADQGIKLEEAVKLIQRALDVDPYNGAYLDSLGWAYFKLSQLDKAETYLLRAVERVSHDPTIQDHLGDLYYKSGRLRLAEQAWERSREEWQRAAPTEYDADAVAKVEDKLKRVKVRLAQETQKKPPK